MPCGQVGGSLDRASRGRPLPASPSGEASYDAELSELAEHPIEEPVQRLGLGHRTDRVAGLP